MEEVRSPSKAPRRHAAKTPAEDANTLSLPTVTAKRYSAPSSPNQTFVIAAQSSSAVKRRVLPDDAAKSPSFLTPQPQQRGGGVRRVKRRQTMLLTGAATLPQTAMAGQRICVALRIRPFSQNERKLNNKTPCLSVGSNGKIVTIAGPQYQRDFNFERVFAGGLLEATAESSADRQSSVYAELAQPLVGAFLDGYNCTLFAYGQTGSGKTFSISGSTDAPGIVPRACQDIFTRLEPRILAHDCSLEVSYFEIYQEKVVDLLTDRSDDGRSLRLREHPETGPFIEALTRLPVVSLQELNQWIQVGLQSRATAGTGMNEHSSRSHAILQLFLTQIQRENVNDTEQEFRRYSQLNVVDLAGSERSITAQEGAVNSEERYKETISINSSLFCLKRVISILAMGAAAAAGGGDHPRRRSAADPHVPYRDSILTLLLKESLGGNARTVLLAAVSPCSSQREETLSTLRFAADASAVTTRPVVNQDHTLAILTRLKELEAELETYKENSGSVEVLQIRRENARLEHALHSLEEENQRKESALVAKLVEANAALSTAIEKRKALSLLNRLDDVTAPALVELSNDPSLALVCRLDETATSVFGAASSCTFCLQGERIADAHCRIRSDGSQWTIECCDDEAEVFLNGDTVAQKKCLHNLDRVCLGGERFFVAVLSPPADTSEEQRCTHDAALAEYFAKQRPAWERRIRSETRRRLEADQKEVMADLCGVVETTKAQCSQLADELRSTMAEKGRLESDRKRLEQTIDGLSETKSEEARDLRRQLVQLESDYTALRGRHDALLRVQTDSAQELAINQDFGASIERELRALRHTIFSSGDDSDEEATTEEELSRQNSEREQLVAAEFDVQQLNAYLKKLDKLQFFRFKCEQRVEDLGGGDLQPKLHIRLDNIKSKIFTRLSPEETRRRVLQLREYCALVEPDPRCLYPILFNEHDHWINARAANSARSSDLIRVAMYVVRGHLVCRDIHASVAGRDAPSCAATA